MSTTNFPLDASDGGHDDLTPRDLLLRDHARIDAQLSELVATAEAFDTPSFVAPWRAFEHALLAHMATEETVIFPAFLQDHAPLLATLKLEHDEIRGSLDKVGLEVELHEVRLETVLALVARLRAHAAAEDRAFYPLVNGWAERSEGLVQMLRRRLAPRAA